MILDLFTGTLSLFSLPKYLAVQKAAFYANLAVLLFVQGFRKSF